MIERIATWIGESPFGRELAVQVQAADSESVSLLFPHDDRHGAGGALRSSASGKVGMHGGAIASLVTMGSQAVVRSVAGDFDAPSSIVSLDVAYVRSTRSSLTATTRAVRHVRELVFLETEIAGEDGAITARASSVVRLGPAAGETGGRGIVAPIGEGNPHLLDAFRSALRTIPFIASRELGIAAAGPGRVDMTLGAPEANRDRTGAIHEGAALTLLDVAGATSPWTVATPSARAAGATVSLSAHFVAPLPSDGLLARATVRAADARMCWSDVALLGRTGETLHAFGTVAYRYGD
ncbi:PaaI family thioesterase [Pendulispora brunnea]|uniref:PaaI family thioesterase n=1 Tax=Pendulispora brunnea TaxID=2905690 RepID=A0ABZ2K3Q2_9BACT